MIQKGLIKRSVFITAVVFISHYFSGFLEQMVVAGNQMAWAYLFLWYVTWIYGGLIIYQKYICKGGY